jgi:large subunit ribosomal protein L22
MKVVDLIRGKSCEEAISILSFTPKKASAITLKVLRSAISNATNKDKDVNIEGLVVKNAYVGQGPMLKRYHTRARGQSDMITHRTSHICVVVGDHGAEG